MSDPTSITDIVYGSAKSNLSHRKCINCGDENEIDIVVCRTCEENLDDQKPITAHDILKCRAWPRVYAAPYIYDEPHVKSIIMSQYAKSKFIELKAQHVEMKLSGSRYIGCKHEIFNKYPKYELQVGVWDVYIDCPEGEGYYSIMAMRKDLDNKDNPTEYRMSYEFTSVGKSMGFISDKSINNVAQGIADSTNEAGYCLQSIEESDIDDEPLQVDDDESHVILMKESIKGYDDVRVYMSYGDTKSKSGPREINAFMLTTSPHKTWDPDFVFTESQYTGISSSSPMYEYTSPKQIGDVT